MIEKDRERDGLRRRRVRLAYDKLGGKRLFGSPADFDRAIPAGLPVEALADLQRIFSAEELDELLAPGRPLSRRAGRERLLNEAESERAVRVAFLTSLAEKIFGDDERAHFWLRAPASALGGKRPIELADSEEGTGDAEELLHRIAHGIVA